MSTRDPGERKLLDRRYRVERVVATRPLGRTFQARHIGLDALVALKELRCPAETPPEARDRARTLFFAEARQLTALGHPGLPRVHDYFGSGEACILVSDFIEGESLARRVARVGAVPVRAALGYALQLCDTLAYLHRQQRPLTLGRLDPANVLITAEDRAVPVDLGLGRLFEQALYAETVQPAPPRADVVALGTLLRFMVEGVGTPSARQDASVPRGQGGQTPPVVAEVIARALDQTAPDAFTSVAELGTALQSAARALFGPLRPNTRESPFDSESGALPGFDQPTLGAAPFAGVGVPGAAVAAAWWTGPDARASAWRGAGARGRPVGARRRGALLGISAASVALAATLAVVVAAGLPSGRLGSAQAGPTGGAGSAGTTLGAGLTPEPKSADGQLVGSPPRANPPVRQKIQPPTPTPVPPTPTPQPTATPVATATPTATPSPTPSPSATPTPSPTPTETPTATPSPTPEPTETPPATSTPLPSPWPPAPTWPVVLPTLTPSVPTP
jgi:hypothetical protein